MENSWALHLLQSFREQWSFCVCCTSEITFEWSWHNSESSNIWASKFWTQVLVTNTEMCWEHYTEERNIQREEKGNCCWSGWHCRWLIYSTNTSWSSCTSNYMYIFIHVTFHTVTTTNDTTSVTIGFLVSSNAGATKSVAFTFLSMSIVVSPRIIFTRLSNNIITLSVIINCSLFCASHFWTNLLQPAYF